MDHFHPFSILMLNYQRVKTIKAAWMTIVHQHSSGHGGERNPLWQVNTSDVWVHVARRLGVFLNF
jgi:lipopolysaccharide assembly outer membrane protein LptD (OstA)